MPKVKCLYAFISPQYRLTSTYSLRIRERSVLFIFIIKTGIYAVQSDHLSSIQGGKNRRRGKNENDDDKRELVFREDGQQYAQVIKMLGNGRLEAQCFDGEKRLAHIRGKMRKKVRVEAICIYVCQAVVLTFLFACVRSGSIKETSFSCL